jgi:salicylate hydroxylase
MDILILGGGIAGLTSALALTKFAPKGMVPKIQIFEIRSLPATIGGAGELKVDLIYPILFDNYSKSYS